MADATDSEMPEAKRRCTDSDAERSFYDNLMQAIEEGNLDTAAGLLKSNSFNLDTVINNWTPLLLAVDMNRVDFVELLVSHGAGLNFGTETTNLPLHLASELGDEPVARTLLKAGADVNKTDFENRTALRMAIRANKPALVNLLLASGAAINVHWKWHECPLYAAFVYPNMDNKDMQHIVMILLRHGVAAHSSYGIVYNPLYWSFYYAYKHAARMLMECGARVSRRGWSLDNAALARQVSSDATMLEWLTAHTDGPTSLKCLSASVIRMHLAEKYKRSILEPLTKLPLPTRIIEYLTLERFNSQIFSHEGS